MNTDQKLSGKSNTDAANEEILQAANLHKN